MGYKEVGKYRKILVRCILGISTGLRDHPEYHGLLASRLFDEDYCNWGAGNRGELDSRMGFDTGARSWRSRLVKTL